MTPLVMLESEAVDLVRDKMAELATILRVYASDYETAMARISKAIATDELDQFSPSDLKHVLRQTIANAVTAIDVMRGAETFLQEVVAKLADGDGEDGAGEIRGPLH